MKSKRCRFDFVYGLLRSYKLKLLSKSTYFTLALLLIEVLCVLLLTDVACPFINLVTSFISLSNKAICGISVDPINIAFVKLPEFDVVTIVDSAGVVVVTFAVWIKRFDERCLLLLLSLLLLVIFNGVCLDDDKLTMDGVNDVCEFGYRFIKLQACSFAVIVVLAPGTIDPVVLIISFDEF